MSESMQTENKENNNKKISFMGISLDKRIAAAIFLFVFISIFLLQNYYFIKRDSIFRHSDGQLLRTLAYHLYFKTDNPQLKEAYFDIMRVPYPPLVYFNSIIFFSALGLSVETARLSISIFAVIFLLAMFGIGYEMGGYYSGIAVMCLAASSPHILSGSRVFFLDFPETALTALAFYVLLKSDGFRDRKFSILFGIVLAVGFMAKWQTAIYIFIPMLWLLIPNIFKSKRSFLTFLGFLVPLGFILWSGYRFFHTVDSHLEFNDLIGSYLRIVFLPSVICIVIACFMNRAWKGSKNFSESGASRIINFAIFAAVFFMLVSPWFLWAGPEIRGKFIADTTEYRSFVECDIVRNTFIRTMFNFSPFFFLGGLICSFIYRKNLYRNLLIPVNLLFAYIFIGRLRLPEFRYMSSMVIFAAAMGGYWVTYTKKLKPAIALIIFVISLLSILAWTVIPGNCPFYQQIVFPPENPMTRILITDGPDNRSYNLSGVKKEIVSRMKSPREQVILMDYTYFMPEGEAIFINERLEWELMKPGTGVVEIFQCMDSNGVRKKFSQEDIAEILKNGKADKILILHTEKEFPRPPIEDFERNYPDISYKMETYGIGRGIMITILNLQHEKREPVTQ